jgi:hypothetical protein
VFIAVDDIAVDLGNGLVGEIVQLELGNRARVWTYAGTDVAYPGTSGTCRASGCDGSSFAQVDNKAFRLHVSEPFLFQMQKQMLLQCDRTFMKMISNDI